MIYMLHRPLLLLIVTLVISARWSPAHATTYFVRASGDDSRDGLSPATAFASVKPAARLLQNPGDRLIVGPGTYSEGNIKPRGSGTADAPIVIQADVTGALTGDPPGPVVIVPPNTPDTTTGIIVYGRHDIVIEGFDIDGADDAGIQVRPHSRTGADSHSITIRNNSVRNGQRKGIHVIAAGDVDVRGNRVTRNGGAGVSLIGGSDVRQRPQVSENVVEENRFGLVIQRSLGGTVANNILRANRKGVSLRECDGLSLTGNDVLETFRAMSGSAANLTVTDNVLDGGGLLDLNGTTRFSRNELRAQVYSLDLYLRGVGDADVELTSNRFFAGPLYLSFVTQLTAAQNEGRAFFASAMNATVVDNRFERAVEVAAEVNLELSRNVTHYVEARGTQVEMRDNELTGFADVLAASATVTGNRARRVVVMRRLTTDPTDPTENARGPYLIERNVSETAVRVGNRREPLANPVIQDNEAGTMVRAYACGDVQVRRNKARGIIGIVSGPDSQLTLRENTSRQSLEAGLIAIGAARAVIESNTSVDNQDSGLAARGIRDLTITGNTLQANPAGGISVLVPIAGDCNSDIAVSVNELVTVVRIALEQTELATCRPADASGDEIVTIDEILLAVRAAYGRLNPRAGTIEIRGNRVEDNGRFGVNVFTDGTVLATGNRVLRNGGIAIAVHGRGAENGTAITGNFLGSGAAEGLFLNGTLAARVRNNVIFSNREAGILLRDAPRTSVVNNLIYANGDDGISVGLGTDLPAHEATLANNTIYANAGWGVTMGTAGAPSKGTVVLNNIIDGNLRGGVAAERDSRTGLAIDFNLNNDGNDPTIPESTTEFEGDPRFIAAAGPDGILGGVGFEDDDLHLQPGTSAIDAGSAPASELGITGSAIAGQDSDAGIVDVGFHYGAD